MSSPLRGIVVAVGTFALPLVIAPIHGPWIRCAAAQSQDESPQDSSAATETPAIEKTDRQIEVIELSIEDAVKASLEGSFVVKVGLARRQFEARQAIIERAVFDPYFGGEVRYAKNRYPTASFLDVGGAGLQGVTTNPFETTLYSALVGGRTIWGTDYTVRLSQSSLDQPKASGSIFGINPQERATLSFEITQPLLQGGWRDYNSARIRIASNREQISNHDLELRATDLVYQVEVAYWQLQFARHNTEVRVQALNAAADFVRLAKESLEGGAMSRSDVLAAESQQAIREVELNEAQTLLEDSRDRLLSLMNFRSDASEPNPSFSGLDIIPTTAASTETIPTQRDTAIQIAFENRADYQRLLLESENEGIRVDSARNELLPELDAKFSWEQQGLDDDFDTSFSSLSDGRFYGWSVGLELKIPLSRRGPRNRVLQAEDRARELNFRRAEIENEIRVQVDQSLRRIDSVRERLSSLDRRVEVHENLLAQEKEKLRLGTTVYYTVSLIESDLLESKSLALRARAEYEAAKADFLRATGSLLETRGVAPPTSEE